ncbi:MAG: TetR/AcrR family transcriptional regulator [Termitinemataceae bacterium]|nr:MAG: TetR/AcrR family transcriptional regulator [Termitinemataceae bacterium]
MIQSSKRDDLLNAALKLIAGQGFHAAPMSQIAEEAKIGVGTIYRYFKNKDELINGLYLEIRKRMAVAIGKDQDETAPVKAQFVKSLQNLISYLVEHPTEIQFTEQYENSPFITEATKAEIEKVASPISDLLIRAQTEKLLKPLPFPVLMSMFSGASMGLLKACMQKKSSPAKTGDTSRNEAIEALWDMLIPKNTEGVK